MGPFKKSTPQGSGKSTTSVTERKKGFPLETSETNNRQGKLDNHTKSQASQMNKGKSGKGPVKGSDLKATSRTELPASKAVSHGVSAKLLATGYSGVK